MDEYKVLIKMDLQFFAKDGPGGEKTEEPTAKKLSEARKNGQVAKSKDLGNSVTLLVAFLVLKMYIPEMAQRFMEVYSFVYNKIPEIINSNYGLITINTATSLINELIIEMALIVLPVFALGVVIGIVINIVQVKWQVSTKPLSPKLSKLSPLKGFKRMFSTRTLVETLKSIALILLISIIVYNTLIDKIPLILNIYEVSLNSAIAEVGEIVLDLGMRISMFYIVIGVADLYYQKKKFHKDMMMTKQEIKDEYKNSEGDPKVKGQIRRRMQEASMRRMMQSLPTADVVITNPTHLAVALKYDADNGNAPVVVAKGEDYLAQKIKEKAKEFKIEIVENKPLARMLYFNVDVGAQIPPELYQAVAEVLAYVYNLKKK